MLKGFLAKRAPLGANCSRTFFDNVLPECFRPLPLMQDVPKQESPPILPNSHMGSFHNSAAGGYNGLLAKNYEYTKNPQVAMRLHEQMKRSSVPFNVTTYNYLIEAYLKVAMWEEAYRLVYEMERKGIQPNLMTFEVLINGLGRSRGKEGAVEELFDMMQVKYGYVPSLSCWLGRISTWMKRKTQQKAISVYDQMLTERPLAKSSSRVHTALLRSATTHMCWQLLQHIQPNIRTAETALLGSSGQAVVSMRELREIWEFPQLFSYPESLATVRFLAKTLPFLDQGSNVRLLYYAARCGGTATDLAELAMSGLIQDQKSSDKTQVKLALSHIEAYQNAMRPLPYTNLQPELTPAMKSKIEVFTKVLSRTSKGL